MPSLVEILISASIVATIAFAVVRGGTPSPVHATSLAMERALAAARTLAATGDGATVVVEADGAGSLVRVFSSRPIAGAVVPVADPGIVTERVSGSVRFGSGVSTVAEPFAILLSRAGYASVGALHGAFTPSAAPAFDRDPGCSDAAAITVSDASGASETHAFTCAGGTYAAN